MSRRHNELKSVSLRLQAMAYYYSALAAEANEYSDQAEKTRESSHLRELSGRYEQLADDYARMSKENAA